MASRETKRATSKERIARLKRLLALAEKRGAIKWGDHDINLLYRSRSEFYRDCRSIIMMLNQAQDLLSPLQIQWPFLNYSNGTLQIGAASEPNSDEPHERAILSSTGSTPREIEALHAEKFIAPTDPQQPTQRTIPVRVYLSNPRASQTRGADLAIRTLCASIGYELYFELDAEEGSWFKRWIARTIDMVTHEDVLKRLQKAERALELQYLEKHQAHADQPRLEGAAELLRAIGENNAVVQIGSVLLVRKHNENGPAEIIVRTLTQTELVFLEQHQQLLTRPAELLRMLQDIDEEAGADPARPTFP